MSGWHYLVVWLGLCAGSWTVSHLYGRPFDFAQAWHQGTALLAAWGVSMAVRS